MMTQLRPALVIFVLLTLLTGVIYPLVVTLAAQALFPAQANGSLERVNGMVVGSSLIGQSNNDPRYFWSRPSAVNSMLGSSLESLGSSGGTNQGATSAALAQAVEERSATFRTANKLLSDAVITPDMLFASGSGLDPHISPEAARAQIARVAEARGLTVDQVTALVDQFTEGPQLGLLGQPRVNVLLLNLALDRLQ